MIKATVIFFDELLLISTCRDITVFDILIHRKLYTCLSSWYNQSFGIRLCA